MRLRCFTGRHSGLRQALRIGAGLTFLVAAHATAQSGCVAPHSLQIQPGTPPDAAAYAQLGSWFAGRRKFSCAADAFRKAAAMQPDSAQYSYLLGLSLSSAGQPKEAIAALRASLRSDPGSVQAHLALATTLDQSGAQTEAETEWRFALAHDSDSALALESLSRDLLADQNYSAVISLLRPRRAAGALSDKLAIDLSVALSKSGLLQDASDLLRAQLQLHPQSLPVAEAMAGALMLQSRFEEAVEVLGPLAHRNASDMPTQLLYFRTLVLAHKPDAEALGERLLRLDPHQWELLYLVGLLRQQAGDTTAAKRYFAASVAANPGYADSHYRLGVEMAKLGDNADAKEQLDKAMALGLQAPEAHFELAKVLRAVGDASAAQQQLGLYQQELQKQASRAQAAEKAQQASEAEAAGNLQQAIADYRDAVAVDPGEPVLAYKLAMALDKAADHGGERAALEQAIQADPHMALAQNQLGYLDSLDGNTEGAIQHFQLAVQADPSYSKAWLNLAATLCLESKWTDAKDALGHVLALDPTNAPANELLQRINQAQ